MEKGALNCGVYNQRLVIFLSHIRESETLKGSKKPIFPTPLQIVDPPPKGEGLETWKIRPKNGLEDFFPVKAGTNKNQSSGDSATLAHFYSSDWSKLHVCGLAACERAHLLLSYNTVNILGNRPTTIQINLV